MNYKFAVHICIQKAHKSIFNTTKKKYEVHFSSVL